MIHKHENWFTFSYIMNIKHSYCSEQCMHVHEGQIKKTVIMFLIKEFYKSSNHMLTS